VVITCPSCSERYRLSADKIKGKGAKITCPSCQHLFVVFADDGDSRIAGRSLLGPTGSDVTTGAFQAVGLDEAVNPASTTGSIRVVAPGPRGKQRSEVATVATSANGIPVLDGPADTEAPAPSQAAAGETQPEEEDVKASDLDFREVGIVTWKVKVSIGLVYDFSDIMTLKKYLDDQKVTPDDLISHDGKEWVRIGNIGDLDAHFVATWKAARAALKDGPGVGKKARAKAASTEADSESQEAIAAASREVAGGRPNLGPTMEDPFARAREQRRAQGKRRRPPPETQSNSGAWTATIAAVLILGGVLGGAFALQRGSTPPETAGGGETANATATSAPTDDLEAHRNAVRERIREQMQRRQEEIQAGMADEPIMDGEDGEEDALDEALRKARRVAVRPSEQTTQVDQVDEKGFRKPIQRPPVAASQPAAVQSSPTQGSAQMTEQQTRDPGRIYYDNGRKAMDRKNYGSALKMFQTSVDKSPQCGVCWEALASAYQTLGEAQKAAAAFEKAEELGVPVNVARP
jgi:predicted Zn finger-like uncharacterized protein